MRRVILLLVAVMLLQGCRSTKNVPIHDTIYISKYVTDVQVQYDSVYIDRWHTNYVKGDTIILQDSVIIYRYKYYNDTVRLTDTNYVVNNNVVEKVLTKNKYPLLPFGISAILIGLLLLYWKTHR